MLVTISRPAFAVAKPTVLRIRQAQRAFSSNRLYLSDRNDPDNTSSSSSAQSATPPDASKNQLKQMSGIQDAPPQTLDVLKEKAHTWTTKNATVLRRRMDTFSANAQKAFAQLGGRLNEMTGYHEIEQLKKLVVENERNMAEVREAARTAKDDFEAAVARRANSQREVNDLLQRKSSWTDIDVMRFTELVRQDHLHEQEEARAKVAVAETDDKVEAQFSELMRTILSRYHEEQVWSDKIRSASTYGSLAALGLNLAVFVLAIVLVEPWKRRRLVQSFETRVLELNAKNQVVIEEGLRELREHQAAQEKLLEEIQGTQAAFSTTSVQEHEIQSDAAAAHLASSLEMEQNAKGARDRQRVIVASAASALGAGVIGWLLGSKFG